MMGSEKAVVKVAVGFHQAVVPEENALRNGDLLKPFDRQLSNLLEMSTKKESIKNEKAFMSQQRIIRREHK